MARLHTYTTPDITVQYDAKRCIHAAECVNRLRAVFDPDKRPWVQPDNAPADQIAAVIERCPSGALHHQRHDGGPAEAVPTLNTADVQPNGPIYVHGDLTLTDASGTPVHAETRIALCRCGASANKPYCDNSHLSAGFQAGAADRPAVEARTDGGPVTITPTLDGPLKVTGPLTLRDEAGTVIRAGESVWLCRCGASANKPFCDGAHKQTGFKG